MFGEHVIRVRVIFLAFLYTLFWERWAPQEVLIAYITSPLLLLLSWTRILMHRHNHNFELFIWRFASIRSRHKKNFHVWKVPHEIKEEERKKRNHPKHTIKWKFPFLKHNCFKSGHITISHRNCIACKSLPQVKITLWSPTIFCCKDLSIVRFVSN